MDMAFQKIGHRGQANMGMRAHIDALPCQKLCRTHLVKKDKRPHHLPLGRG